jgi:hypothetical protein
LQAVLAFDPSMTEPLQRSEVPGAGSG